MNRRYQAVAYCRDDVEGSRWVTIATGSTLEKCEAKFAKRQAQPPITKFWDGCLVRVYVTPEHGFIKTLQERA